MTGKQMNPPTPQTETSQEIQQTVAPTQECQTENGKTDRRVTRSKKGKKVGAATEEIDETSIDPQNGGTTSSQVDQQNTQDEQLSELIKNMLASGISVKSIRDTMTRESKEIKKRERTTSPGRGMAKKNLNVNENRNMELMPRSVP